jgi:hypothetical protein
VFLLVAHGDYREEGRYLTYYGVGFAFPFQDFDALLDCLGGEQRAFIPV